MKYFGSTLILPLFWGIATAQASDAFEQARAAFARTVAAAYPTAQDKTVVQPQYSGLPDNPYDELETPPFFAFRADWPGMDPGPRGFATADGRAIVARHSGAIRDLLEAAGTAHSPVPAEAVVRRLMWLYQPDPGNRLITWHPVQSRVAEPVVKQNEDGTIHVAWFVERGGGTGFVGVYHANFTLTPQNRPRFTESLLQ
ncbi:hypothetical protein [Hoeflea alexandrii]|uniref:hypothetical protein n=1 Tax=Hoeflea alexandrii TaxID=288436 RepID=UPI0022B02880|nr:hypothetical protein [Hoeflea alexandrii]MCZ4291532.1 hypothetical protein [Hoeflea alexandrii]